MGFLKLNLFMSGALILAAVAVQAQTAKPDLSTNAPAEPPAMVAEPAGQAPVDTKGGPGTLTSPQVRFAEPTNGATVPQDFTVKFEITGMKIAPAGEPIPGTGHHHLIIDGTPVKKGEIVPADAKHIHFGLGQTETKLRLSKGPHTLTLQFADGKHGSYGEALSQTIKITVK